jgi:oligopeptide/dipeptide ABC transporter ATP-binding protein
VHEGTSRGKAWRRALDLLKAVRIASPKTRLSQHPHEMSGGMRQRIVGAIGISCEPRLLIADEPTTSLDLTIQAQYLNLCASCSARTAWRLDLHHPQPRHRRQDVRPAGGDVCGRVVESGPGRQIFNAPAHPYTQALLNSIPRMSDKRSAADRHRRPAAGSGRAAAGCAFAPRCPSAFDRCREAPPRSSIGDRRTVRCWLLTPRSDACGQPSAQRSGLMVVLEAPD